MIGFDTQVCLFAPMRENIVEAEISDGEGEEDPQVVRRFFAPFSTITRSKDRLTSKQMISAGTQSDASE